MADRKIAFDLLARDKASAAFVKVGAEADKTRGKFADLAKSGKGLSGSFSGLSKAGGLLAGGLLGGGLVAGLKSTVDSFAAVEDATGAAGVMFGKQLPSVTKFAEQAAQAFGLSKRQALEAQNTFGTLGKAAGLSGSNLTGFAQNLTGLAGDLASFKGTSTEQAIDAVGAALRGESEPIRAYGVLLDDASIQAEALAKGLVKPVANAEKVRAAQVGLKVAQAGLSDAIKKHGENSLQAQKAQVAYASASDKLKTATQGSVTPLTAANKTLAVQSLILKGTTDAQGDFARTADSTANTQKRLSAESENAQASIGQRLAPAMTKLREGMLKALDVGAKLAALFRDHKGVVLGLGAAVGALAAVTAIHAATMAVSAAGGMTAWIKGTKIASAVTKSWAAVQWALNAAMTANPIGIAVVAIAALGTALFVAYRKSETFRNIVNTAFGAVAAAAKGLWENGIRPAFKFIADAWFTVVGALIGGAAKAFGWVPGIGPKLKAAAGKFNDFRDTVSTALDGTATDAERLGGHIVDGLIVGMTAKQEKAYRTAYNISGQTAGAMRDGAVTASPSKITTYVGRMIGEGLIKGMNEKRTAAIKVAEALAAKVANALTIAKDRLQGLKDQSAQLRDMARDNAKSFASILGFQGTEGKATTSGDILASMKTRLAALKAFRQNLSQLQKLGLNRGTYNDLLSGGVEQGGALAAALLSGGKAGIGQVNSLQTQIDANAGTLGNNAARFTYGDAIEEQQNVVVQLVLDGKVIQQSLVKLKRTNGRPLGLA